MRKINYIDWIKKILIVVFLLLILMSILSLINVIRIDIVVTCTIAVALANILLSLMSIEQYNQSKEIIQETRHSWRFDKTPIPFCKNVEFFVEHPKYFHTSELYSRYYLNYNIDIMSEDIALSNIVKSVIIYYVHDEKKQNESISQNIFIISKDNMSNIDEPSSSFLFTEDNDNQIFDLLLNYNPLKCPYINIYIYYKNIHKACFMNKQVFKIHIDNDIRKKLLQYQSVIKSASYKYDVQIRNIKNSKNTEESVSNIRIINDLLRKETNLDDIKLILEFMNQYSKVVTISDDDYEKIIKSSSYPLFITNAMTSPPCLNRDE